MRKQYDLKTAIAALTEPRLVHHSQPDADGVLRLITVEHPSLVGLLEQGTGAAARAGSGSGSGGSGMPGPIDAGALETWAQIRDQVRAWLHQLRAPWSDDLTADLRTWYAHHELAAARGRIQDDALETIERTVEAWKARIERKYDPDERREWTEPCPAYVTVTDRWGIPTGQTKRCGARRIPIAGALQFAIELNITQLEAECRSCGKRWEGQRELMMLRYESNLYELDRELEAAAARDVVERRDLALTGPIDLP